jgi:TnpA family transposase
MIDDEGYRRTMSPQINVQEERHSLARKIFHGRHGTCASATGRARRTSWARSAWS